MAKKNRKNSSEVCKARAQRKLTGKRHRRSQNRGGPQSGPFHRR